MARLRYNNALGLLGAGLTSGGTTITFSPAPAFATLTGDDYIPLQLDPPASHTPSASFEVVYLTAYTAGATTGTISRGQEGTSGVSHSTAAQWVAGPTASDEINQATTTKAFTGLVQGVETGSTMPMPGRCCNLVKFQADQPCRFRIYATQAQATADIGRSVFNDPTGNHGCLFEIVLTAAATFNVSPEVLLTNQDSPTSSTFYCNVRCDNGTTLNVTPTGMVLMP